MKRLIASLLIVLATATAYAEFGTDGGFAQLLRDTFVRESAADSIALVDTVIVSNASTSVLFYPTAQFNPTAGRFYAIRFASATTTTALRDTTRYLTRIGTGGVSDTLVVSVALGAASANTDSVFITEYVNNGVKIDTVSTVEHEWPYTFAHNVFWSRLDRLDYADSTGVLVNVQTKFGATDEWATIASHALDADNEEAYTVLSDSSATVQMGSRYRTMVVTYDSTRGARVNGSTVEVVWKGRK